MDYLEGALLGPVWSDTDYENRTHKGAALLISTVFWAGFVYLLLSFYADNLSPWLQTPSIWMIATLAAVLAAPVLCYYYYNLPLLFRFVALIFQAAKYVAAVLIIYSLVIPAISLNVDSLLPDLLEWMDKTVGTFVERNTEVYELFGLLVSGIVLVLGGAIAFILALFAIVLSPILYVQIVKFVQRLFDLMFLSLMKQIRRFLLRYKKNEQLKAEGMRGQIDEADAYETTGTNYVATVRDPEIRSPEGIRNSEDRRSVRSKQTKPPETFK